MKGTALIPSRMRNVRVKAAGTYITYFRRGEKDELRVLGPTTEDIELVVSIVRNWELKNGNSTAQ